MRAGFLLSGGDGPIGSSAPNPAPGRAPIPVPPNAGFDLGTVYLVWIGLVLALYPDCRWFARLKRTRRSAWLSYL